MPDGNFKDLQRPRSQLTRDRSRSDVADSLELEEVQKQAVHDSIEHLHGPKGVDYAKDEIIVLTQVRNSRPYLKSFIEHYFSLGAKHLVFLDNGSTDGTVEALKKHKGVTVLGTELPYRTYNVAMKQYLIERFGKDRWSLLVDIDELFDYPFSNVVGLKALLGYLNGRRYTAVVAHMLDMFPEGSLSETIGNGDVSVKELNRFYDLSNITAHDYRNAEDSDNVMSNEEIKILQGGVQRRLFNIHPLLIKHPLVFFDGEVRPVDFSEHWAGNAHIADFSGVLLHYKLLGSLYGLARQEVEERRYVNRHGKYDKYRKVLDASPELLIKRDTSRELESVNDLIGTQLAVVSKEYVRFIGKESQKSEDYSRDGELDRIYEIFLRRKAETKVQSISSEPPRRENVQLQRLRQENAQLQRLRQENARLRQRMEEMQNGIEWLERRSGWFETRQRNLEIQMLGVQSSRSWRLMDRLNRLLLQTLGEGYKRILALSRRGR